MTYYSELVKRLRVKADWLADGKANYTHGGTDWFFVRLSQAANHQREAADAITTLTARVAELEGLLTMVSNLSSEQFWKERPRIIAALKGGDE